ncbi:MAG: hypothetical protein O8C63_02375 [Candidatus Methanoperedens sp.]|nr:hypothetical protein [Candidatus Methanoperedens sp.]
MTLMHTDYVSVKIRPIRVIRVLCRGVFHIDMFSATGCPLERRTAASRTRTQADAGSFRTCGRRTSWRV